MYDAIVIGARCGGAPVAMLLARRGHRVLLVDRATFPSDTMSTHGIPFRGLAKLREWGLHKRLLAEAVDAGLAGAQRWPDALAGYEQRRNEAALPLYEINCRDASFTPPSPDELRLRAALRDGDPADVDAMYSAVFGTIPYESFFGASNLVRILGSAAAQAG